MELWPVGINPVLVSAWTDELVAFPDVHIVEGDILKIAKNTIVSPTNSYGFMDGGIDRLHTDFFGLRPQPEIQKQIALRPEGLQKGRPADPQSP